MQTIFDIAKPKRNAIWVIFYSYALDPDDGIYYDAQPILQMSYKLMMLAYNMDDDTFSPGYGAPLRLQNEVQLGFKLVKWIKGIEFDEHFFEMDGSLAGYNNGHEFFGYRQSI
ncbi:molybdopterin-dependent oxidoreductase [Cryobacterium sp. Y11]|uniref:molybdopterin-dependent oxidoreductase n=1 Tax=Cryobacterium sp. Y11 TaxID=2045016 RepID=UPI001E4C67C1|nr:molybdopterin-dependent oxidoreductase [Cryobacterium sp. Y11]